MKKIIYFIVAAALVCGCSKDEKTFQIYGTVFEGNEPASLLELVLREGSAYGDVVGSTITGNDGYYSFDNIKPQSIVFDDFGSDFYISAGGVKIHISPDGPTSIKRDIKL
jgi:hypothetical protein